MIMSALDPGIVPSTPITRELFFEKSPKCIDFCEFVIKMQMKLFIRRAERGIWHQRPCSRAVDVFYVLHVPILLCKCRCRRFDRVK